MRGRLPSSEIIKSATTFKPNKNMLSANKHPVKLGLEIQAEQLLEWSAKLSSELYLDLCKEARRCNAALTPEATCGDVWRGQDLNEFVCNWTPKNYPRYAI